MNWFAIIKRHYDAGRYSRADVAIFVLGGKISSQEYDEITDEPYTEVAP